MLVLGIESSCDETAAAIVADGAEILSNVVASQIPTHEKYGGVVPELASREHLRKIGPIVGEACRRARVGIRDVEGIAVTEGPGLIGSLLVGLVYGKALAFALSKPLVGVNHLEGHIHAVCSKTKWPASQGNRSRRRPSHPLRWSSRVGTRACSLSRKAVIRPMGILSSTTRGWDIHAMMPPGKLSIRWRNSWHWAIPVDRSSTSWRARGILKQSILATSR